MTAARLRRLTLTNFRSYRAAQIEIAAPLRNDPQLNATLVRDLASAIRTLVFLWVERR